jgi:hypothetical protein
VRRLHAKKRWWLVAVLSMLAAAALTVGASAATVGQTTFPMIAGQNQTVGTVTVDVVDSTTVTVSYATNSGWCMTQTHVDVVTNTTDFPLNKSGNPQVGLFPQGTTFTPNCVSTAGPYTFTINTTGNLYVAAHAVVWDKNSQTSFDVVSHAGSAVTAFNGSPVSQTAVAANEPFTYPDCNTYSPSDTAQSLWDTGIGTTAFNAFNSAGADWIWPTLNPRDPITGEYADFTETFSISGLPVSGSLLITADNGYKASVNGGSVGSAQLGPGFPSTLLETVVPGAPQTGDWGVASQGWQTVETWPVSGLKTGSNSLVVTAADEYMWNDGGYLGADFYDAGYDPVGGPITPDPAPGVGSADGSLCTNPGYNPGGVIYKLSVSQYTTSATSWGGNTAFNGGSWATYYTVP